MGVQNLTIAQNRPILFIIKYQDKRSIGFDPR